MVQEENPRAGLELNESKKLEDMTITEKLDALYKSQIGDPSKKKTLKSWLVKKLKLNPNKAKKGYVSVIFLKANNNADIKRLPIIDNFIKLPGQDKYHTAQPDEILYFGKQPFMIVPEFDMRPVTIERLFDKTTETGSSSVHEQILIQIMHKSEIKEKKGLPMNWIIIGLIVIVGLYLLSKLF